MLDVIIILIIAVFLLNKLFGMLGKTDEDSAQRSGSIIERMIQEILAKQRMQFGGKNDATHVNAEGDSSESGKPINAEIISVAEALLEPQSKEVVKNLQNTEDFNLEDFINKAKKAFSIIITANSNADIETLMHLLDEQLFASFTEKIDEKKAKNHQIEHNIVSIKSLDVLKAYVIEDKAYIKVKICSEQGYWIKDEKGKVIEGNEGKISVIYSTWTFAKTLGAANKIWLLTEIQEGKTNAL